MTQYKVVAFGGGCFWCTEAVFLQLKGVRSVTSGYAGGVAPDPTYAKVSLGKTGHAEVVKVEYDSDVLSFRKLLEVFFMSHDPTTLNRQGNDLGEQYRSIILYTSEKQKQEAELYIQELNKGRKYSQPIVTQVVPLGEFYKAEEYHQNYFARNPEQPYSEVTIKPKVEKIREERPELLK